MNTRPTPGVTDNQGLQDHITDVLYPVVHPPEWANQISRWIADDLTPLITTAHVAALELHQPYTVTDNPIWAGDGRYGWLSLPVVFVVAFTVESKGGGR